MLRCFAFSSILTVVSLGATAQSNTVYRLEAFLAELGFNPGPVDGTVDDATHAGIRAYQTSRGLPVTGGMTQEQFDTLEREIVAHRAGKPASQRPIAQQPNAPAAQAAATVASQNGKTTVHRLTQPCRGDHGLVWFRYQAHPPQRLTKLEISEACWNATAGQFLASESMTGLTLVSSVDGFEKFEQLHSGAEDWQRNSIWVTRHDPEGESDALGWASQLNYNSNTKTRAAQFDTLIWDGGGFVTSDRYSPASARGPFTFSLELSFGPQGEINPACSAGAPGNPSYLPLRATIDLRSLRDVPLQGAEATIGRVQGTLSLTATAEGEVTGTASVYFENPRKAGHGPCEWLRAQVDLDTLIGLTTGRTGTELQGVGAGEGRFTDVTGNTYRIHVLANFSAYPQF